MFLRMVSSRRVDMVVVISSARVFSRLLELRKRLLMIPSCSPTHHHHPRTTN
jgi:hypothetical protein